MRNIAFVVGDGIGNQIQTIPAFLCLKEKFPQERISVINSFPTNPIATKLIFKNIADEIVILKNTSVDFRQKYRGQFVMYPMRHKLRGIKVLNNNIKSNRVPEVEFNLMSVDKKMPTEFFNKSISFFYSIKQNKNCTDIIIHNGYSRVSDRAKKLWKAKSYPYYEQLADVLKSLNLRVGSIGDKKEHVKGTEDFTGLSLSESIGVIKGCKILISNDTASYHIANILGIRNIAIFTFTDTRKNYSSLFHKFTTIIRREDLPCSPCQFGHDGHFWLKNKNKCLWECRRIPVSDISKKVIEMIDKK